MSVLTLAVFSDSVDYVNRFLAFFRTNQNDLFDTIGFTDAAALKSYLSAGRIDILLLSRGSYHDLNTSAIFSKGKEDNSIGNFIDPEVVKELVILGEHQNLSSAPKEINMFRSMSEISRDIEKIASSMIPEGHTASSDVSVKGIFALDGSPEPVKVALHILPERGRTLFVDLDRFSPLPYSIRTSNAHELSDLLFLYKSGSADFPSLVKDCIWEYQDMDILSSPATAFDLEEIRSFEWQGFFNSIAQAGRYSCLILNLADSVQDLFGMFSACEEVFIISEHFQALSQDGFPPEGASYSLKRAAAFRKYFEENNFSGLISLMKPAVFSEPDPLTDASLKRTLFKRR